MSEDRTPADEAWEHAVEVCVYAPIGLVFAGASMLPELIERGRSQVELARAMGKFTVRKGQNRATQAVGRLQDQAAGLLDFVGDSVAPLPSAPPPVPRTTARVATVVTQAQAAVGPIVAVASLAIPDYDGLSASQVVNRLAGLSESELEAVRGYESAQRGRQTILSKVAQLQGQ